MTGSAANTAWARSLIDELARSGLREVVVAPGSRSTPLVMACSADERIRVRVHLDERSCGFFALGIGKSTGRPAAVVTTSGTAVANLYPAVVEASQSGVPLIVLSADRPHRLRGADANQAIDQVHLFGTYPRAFFELPEPTLEARALRHVRGLAVRAWASACGHRAGPVHINVPFDKPLEPATPPEELMIADPVAFGGRPDGAPFVTIDSARPCASDETLAAVEERLRGRTGVIVAGPAEDRERVGPAVRRFALATGFPVLADPLSGARFGFDDDAIAVAAYDLFLRDEEVRARLAPDVVLRIGASPTSAALQRWLFQHADAAQIVIDDGPRWKDHGGTAVTYLVADAADALDRLAEQWSEHPPADTESGSDAWARADAAAREALAALDPGSLGEGGVAASVVRALPEGAALVVSSSMPIRDVDAFARPDSGAVSVLSNRGASGIDGVVSTAFGVASQHEGVTALVIGDVAFFHDQNGLLWSREADAPLVIVLVDNDGGAIFGMLPIAGYEPDFTTYFTTPHGLDLSHTARGHDIQVEDVAIVDVEEAVRKAVASGRTKLLHVRTDGGEGHRLRSAARDAVVARVLDVLA